MGIGPAFGFFGPTLRDSSGCEIPRNVVPFLMRTSPENKNRPGTAGHVRITQTSSASAKWRQIRPVENIRQPPSRVSQNGPILLKSYHQLPRSQTPFENAAYRSS